MTGYRDGNLVGGRTYSFSLLELLLVKVDQ